MSSAIAGKHVAYASKSPEQSRNCTLTAMPPGPMRSTSWILKPLVGWYPRSCSGRVPASSLHRRVLPPSRGPTTQILTLFVDMAPVGLLRI